jgi:hypothetical protein
MDVENIKRRLIEGEHVAGVDLFDICSSSRNAHPDQSGALKSNLEVFLANVSGSPASGTGQQWQSRRPLALALTKSPSMEALEALETSESPSILLLSMELTNPSALA